MKKNTNARNNGSSILVVDFDATTVSTRKCLQDKAFPAFFDDWVGCVGPVLFFTRQNFERIKVEFPNQWLDRFDKKFFLSAEGGAAAFRFAFPQGEWEAFQEVRVPFADSLQRSLREAIQSNKLSGDLSEEFGLSIQLALEPDSRFSKEAILPEWICDCIPGTISMRRDENKIVFSHPLANKFSVVKQIARRFPELDICRMVEFDSFWINGGDFAMDALSFSKNHQGRFDVSVLDSGRQFVEHELIE